MSMLNSIFLYLRYEEAYSSALDGWREASNLDPQWPEPKLRINELQLYLKKVSLFVAQKGKLKSKRLQGLIKSIDDKCLGSVVNAIKMYIPYRKYHLVNGMIILYLQVHITRETLCMVRKEKFWKIACSIKLKMVLM